MLNYFLMNFTSGFDFIDQQADNCLNLLESQCPNEREVSSYR